ncbi:hypothetical protein HMPREF0724_10747 [Prescottella equi ATCC 33707]|uniref:Uncharacterized protein n=1 Tax=Prescottella equi ATCC 33707 TaxID=525370 RepID=E9SX96_RHOHA|nr:hypothetical protein HMPREF0724_10747 [Prescottella equi ATCC 33707]
MRRETRSLAKSDHPSSSYRYSIVTAATDRSVCPVRGAVRAPPTSGRPSPPRPIRPVRPTLLLQPRPTASMVEG